MQELAGHEYHIIRKYAQELVQNVIPRLQNDFFEAVRFLEVDWEDFRTFAFGLFTEHLSSNWTIENIVHVCDSNRKDVQDFGKAELHKRLFGQEDMTQIDFSIQQRRASCANHKSNDLI